jgi:hypothetical protein
LPTPSDCGIRRAPWVGLPVPARCRPGPPLHGRSWLRRFTLVVRDVADGAVPTAGLGFLARRQPFRVIHDGPQTVVDPRSFARYDAEAAAIASLDTEARPGR